LDWNKKKQEIKGASDRSTPIEAQVVNKSRR